MSWNRAGTKNPLLDISIAIDQPDSVLTQTKHCSTSASVVVGQCWLDGRIKCSLVNRELLICDETERCLAAFIGLLNDKLN